MAGMVKKYTRNSKKSANPTAGYMVPEKGERYEKFEEPPRTTHAQEPLDAPVRHHDTGAVIPARKRGSRVVSAKAVGISGEGTWGRIKTGARKAHGAYMKGAKSFWGGVGELSQGMSDISATLPGSDFSDVLQPIRSNGDWGLGGNWGFGFGGSGPSDNVPDNRQYRTMPRKQRRVPKPKKQKLPDFGFRTRW